MEFSDVLNNLLISRGVTAYKISKDTGISQRLIGYWKKGEKKPTANNLKKLADFFNVTTDYLLTGQELKKQTSPAKKAEEVENAYLDRELEGVRFALSSKDPDLMGDLTLDEKRDVVKFVNFLRSQHIMKDEKDNDKKKDDGGDDGI